MMLAVVADSESQHIENRAVLTSNYMQPSDLVGPVVIHSNDTIQYANKEFRALLGLKPTTDIVDTPLTDFVTEPYRDPLHAQFERIQDESEPIQGLQVKLELDDKATVTAIAVSSEIEWDGKMETHTSFINIVESEDSGAIPLTENAAQQSPIGVSIADATREDEPLVYVNDEFLELTGYSRAEVIGRNCRFLQGAATREEPVAEVRAAINEQRPTTVELRNYRKDGSMFWNRLTISPIKNPNGGVTHFLGFQQDISDRKIYERERALFEKQSEMSNQVMFITDTNGIIEYVNPAFERVTGYSASEAIGKTPQILKSGEQDEEFYKELWETITAGDTWEAELINRAKSGEKYRAHQKIVPITDDRGELTHFAAIERDISDERLTQQVLEVLNRILRHNVRTSINVIDGYAEMLGNGLSEDEQQVAITKIREHTTAINELSEQTTTIRELLSGHEDPTPLKLDRLEAFVERQQKTYENAEITFTPEDSLDASITNGNVFEIAFEEIIENAVTHSDRDTPQIEITVKQSVQDDHAAVTIADNGAGIPKSDWDVVKAGTETPLHHADSLGLWMIYWSVTALGGTVTLSENDPRGSVFTLEIPVNK